jgi:NAD(P) transhydrogenase subunit alpha
VRRNGPRLKSIEKQVNGRIMALTIGVPRETLARKARRHVPEVVEKLIKLGFAVAVESGAGDAANCSDDSYRAAGATEIIDGAASLWAASDIVFKVAYRRRTKSACCAKAAP